MTQVLVGTTVKPRLGFVGVGWIGLNRMSAILCDGCAEAALIADPNDAALEEARAVATTADVCGTLDSVLASNVDGVVIATPSGLHARQAIRALEAGKAVFCQKPLGCTADETRAVVEAARRNDRLLGIDFSYRYATALKTVRRTVRSGSIGSVYAVDLVFHNAYGPNADWARAPERSGGGCVIDLGIHLIDALLWILDSRIVDVTAALFKNGARLERPSPEIEDHAVATLDLSNGASAALACSWHHPAGTDARIEISFHGTNGGATFRNVNGSFYDFVAERRDGATTHVLTSPPDSWGGRAAIAWAERLGRDGAYDPSIESTLEVAAVIDQVYGRT